MNQDARELLEAALKLPPVARAALAGALIESLEETVDQDAELLWEAEIAERVGAFDEGRVRTVPWSIARGTIIGG
jgi:hypothetical protein